MEKEHNALLRFFNEKNGYENALPVKITHYYTEKTIL